MINTNSYILLIEEFHCLYLQERKKWEKEQKMYEHRFSAFCEELYSLYQIEKKNVCNQCIIPFISKNLFLGEVSSLSIINKLNFETFHSQFLKYLWNSQTELGNIAFLNFLEEIGVNDCWLNTLKQNLYRVECEHLTGKQRKRDLNRKRIDLLFIDEVNKWVVVIENKIDSKVHSDLKSNRSQLDIYHDYCERRFQDYHKVYILLSYNKNNSRYAENSNSWLYADYYHVFKSLLNYSSQNDIVRDYLKTLFFLLFPNIKLNKDYVNCSLYRSTLFFYHIISKIQ